MLEDQVRDLERIVQSQNDWRLQKTINLIASENAMSERARALLNSDFTHRYAEGHPGARYYMGTDYIDVVETRVREAMEKIFGAAHAEVRTISGTNANESVFGALVKRDAKVLVNSLPGGGHISHQKVGGLGKITRDINAFPRTEDGWRIDIEKTRDYIRKEKPDVVVFGKSVILFREPVKELIDTCREEGVTTIYDGAHVLGLIAGKTLQDPLAEGADVLLGSTHKTFFGPQRGVVLSNLDDERWSRIDKCAFPGSTSNHHLFTLPSLLMAAYEMMEFGQDYVRQVVTNARHLAKSFDAAGIEVCGKENGFTDTHQVNVNVKKFGGGGKVEVLLKENDIILNRNLLPEDPPKKLNNPSGLRIGVQEMTRFGMKEAEMERIAQLFCECIIEGKSVKEEVNRFRAGFTDIHFSFDSEVSSASGTPMDAGLAGA